MVCNISKTKSKDGLKETKIDTYQGNLYARHIRGNYFINGIVGMAWNEYLSNRSILVANSIANAKYTGQSYVGRIESGFDYQLPNALTLTPLTIITLAENRVNNYGESGAGNLNLAVQNNRSNFFETRFAATLSYNFLTIQGAKITPDITISYGYDFAATKQVTNSNFIGQLSSFVSNGSKIVQGSWRIGTGLKIYYSDAIVVSANYDFDYKENYHGHTGSIKLKYSF